jgi:hypothetical protein
MTQDYGVFSTLTRHFLRGFFRLPFLDQAGEDSFVRGMIGVVVANAILVFGAMARLYFIKYRALSSNPTPDLYRLMLPADQLLTIILPMLVVILVMATVSDGLFPGELDLRVLLPLPVSRRMIFASKSTALFLHTSFFIVVSNAIVAEPFALLSGGRWAEHGPRERLIAQLVAGGGASFFAAATLVAVQGLVAVLAPRHRLQRAMIAVRTLFVCEVALLLPVVLRLPRLAESLEQNRWWLKIAAPGWFLGVERMLLGGGTADDRRLAGIAIAGTALVSATAVACFLELYRRFDRVSLQTPHRATQRWRRVAIRWPQTTPPALAAVQSFTGATLRRSGPHQLVVFGALSAGLAFALDAALLSGDAGGALTRAAIGAPLIVMIVATLGVRAALLMPTEIRAAWIFRFTERADIRIEQLDAVRLALAWRGILLPALVVAPLQIAILGWGHAGASFPVTLAIGWMLLELVTSDWRRIPFTCTVLFGKRPAAQTFMILCALYVAFGVIGARIAEHAVGGLSSWLVTMSLLTMALCFARWHRLRHWGRLPLEFEDYLPDSVETLGLEL